MPRKAKGKRKARTQVPRAEIALQALQNAVGHESTMNYEAIFEGFAEMGVEVDEILPRENVFTFNAWKALGRVVRKGQHGVKVVTFVPMRQTDKETGEVTETRRPRSTTVFHISQTEVIDDLAKQKYGGNMAAFYIDQIVKGRVCGTFVILGFRRLAGVEHAQLKEYDQAQPGRCRRGELALPLDALQPVLMTRSAYQVVVFTKRGDYWNYTGDRVREIADFMDLTVTKNGDGRAMVGIPEHARKEYASTLRNAGINITFDGATD